MRSQLIDDYKITCVLFLVGTLGTGGKERQLIELIHGLPPEKYRIILLVKNITAHYFEKVREKVILVNLDRKRFGIRSLPDIIGTIRHYKPEIIQSWATPTSSLAIMANWLTGNKCKVIDSSIRHAPAKIDWWSLYGIQRRFIQRFSHAVVANSMAGLASFNVRPSKAHCIYNGFDMKRVADVDRGKIRNEFSLDNFRFVVGMVARFDEMKDYGTYLEAACLITRERKDILFFAVGNGPLLNELRSSIPESCKSNIIFTGNRPDVESVISVFDVAILSTYTEGISNSILEYMALSKPVIATGGGGTGEIITSNDDGRIIKSGDPDLLAREILEMIENENTRIQTGKNGFKIVSEKFSLELMIRNFEKLYTKITRNDHQGF